VAYNIAFVGAGLFNNDADDLIHVENSIIAFNTADPANDQDVSGSFESGDFNILTTDDSGDFTEADDLVGVDPRLGALALNGGTTRTHALLAGSPALNSGDTGLTIDQRGFGRPSGGVDDRGAFEA
jgi:hypothetical protein